MNFANIGYYGMLLNSSSTELVPIVHEVFTPSAQEVALWLDLVAAEEAAARAGRKAVRGSRSQGEGHVLHGSQVKAARRNLEWARALAEQAVSHCPGWSRTFESSGPEWPRAGLRRESDAAGWGGYRRDLHSFRVDPE